MADRRPAFESLRKAPLKSLSNPVQPSGFTFGIDGQKKQINPVKPSAAPGIPQAILGKPNPAQVAHIDQSDVKKLYFLGLTSAASTLAGSSPLGSSPLGSVTRALDPETKLCSVLELPLRRSLESRPSSQERRGSSAEQIGGYSDFPQISSAGELPGWAGRFNAARHEYPILSKMEKYRMLKGG